MSQDTPNVGQICVSFIMNENGWRGDALAVANALATLLKKSGLDIREQPSIELSQKPNEFKVNITAVMPADQIAVLWVAGITLVGYSCALGAIKGQQGITYLHVIYK